MLYKILNNLPAEAAKDGSVDSKTVLPLLPLDLKSGFIHLSTKQQLEGTLNQFFQDVVKVHLLSIDGPDNQSVEIPQGKTGNKYRSEIKWDWADSRQEYFAHIYGDLVNEDIVEVSTLTRQHGHPWKVDF